MIFIFSLLFLLCFSLYDCRPCWRPGEFTLEIGQRIPSSACPNFALVMQNDGNLAIFSSSAALWSTSIGSAPGQANKAVFQSDGGFYVLSPSGTVVWSANHNGALLCFRSNANLVLYDSNRSIVWSSNTPTSCSVNGPFDQSAHAPQYQSQFPFSSQPNYPSSDSSFFPRRRGSWRHFNQRQNQYQGNGRRNWWRQFNYMR